MAGRTFQKVVEDRTASRVRTWPCDWSKWPRLTCGRLWFGRNHSLNSIRRNRNLPSERGKWLDAFESWKGGLLAANVKQWHTASGATNRVPSWRQMERPANEGNRKKRGSGKVDRVGWPSMIALFGLRVSAFRLASPLAGRVNTWQQVKALLSIVPRLDQSRKERAGWWPDRVKRTRDKNDRERKGLSQSNKGRRSGVLYLTNVRRFIMMRAFGAHLESAGGRCVYAGIPRRLFQGTRWAHQASNPPVCWRWLQPPQFFSRRRRNCLGFFSYQIMPRANRIRSPCLSLTAAMADYFMRRTITE